MLFSNMSWQDLIEMEVYKNTLLEWAAAFGIGLLLFVVLALIKETGLRKFRETIVRDPEGWGSSLVEALQNTKKLTILLLSIYIGVRGLTLPPVIADNLRIITLAIFFIQIGLWCVGILNGWAARYREQQITINPGAVSTLGAVRVILIGVIWAGVLLLILDNIGFDITALVAGLGIGGIAIALAVQNILGDLFSSLSIVLDKTFVVGDFIIVGDYMGTVENIGLKTTRIRSLSGEQIVFSNTDLLNGRIRNYGRMYERRISIKLGVIYQTSREKLKKIPVILREAIEAQEKTRFDRAHFLAYGNFSLDFEYVYYVLSSDYNDYMDIHQAINFIIHEKFEAEGIEFAYPTQTLFLEGLKAETKSE
ncbi:mechanosensitive ion channel family protein [Kordiimonas pumila]|uniref:Mechanosensitive ion channel family protein n=1 Tax=Kordiimonas pumila TaxID=2161677 RepID=A0ABV7DAG5_9PROT|nr:mechanosensitive ion channel family protein [Kordiimonas pumila]